MHNLSSTFRAFGVLTLRVRDVKTGKILRTIIKKNMIVSKAQEIVANLLLQPTTLPLVEPGFMQIGSMRFGTSDTPTQTHHTGLLLEPDSLTRKYGAGLVKSSQGGLMLFEATMGSDEGNGNTYQEVGLFTQGSGLGNEDQGNNYIWMFARQIHPAAAKTAGVALDYSWQIQFTIN